jgi:phospholipid-translocating ATPase
LLAVYLFIFQFSLVIIFGAIGESWRRNNGRDHWYMDYPASDSWYEFLIIPLRFLLINSTMIPISLKITLDIIKLFSARFIGWDNQMFDFDNDGPAVANNTSIAEDLGQVTHQFFILLIHFVHLFIDTLVLLIGC